MNIPGSIKTICQRLSEEFLQKLFIIHF